MPAFDAYALDAFAETDALFGEDFVVTPYSQPEANGREQPDATRAEVRLCGVWREKLADVRTPNAYDQRERLRPGTISELPTVEFSPAATLAIAGFELREGDHVERCSTGMVYLTRAPTYSPNGLLRAPLNRLGSAQ